MSATIQLYGIPNCDTVKKARAALAERGIAYDFHDFKRQGVDETMISDWLVQVGWQQLLKKTGPTWARLPQNAKEAITDDASALPVLLAHPNIIKRPVLVRDGKVLATGYNEQTYAELKP